MNKQPEALRLAYLLEVSSDNPTLINVDKRCAAELRRLHHNNELLMDALWRACGDDEEVVNATIESQGELK